MPGKGGYRSVQREATTDAEDERCFLSHCHWIQAVLVRYESVMEAVAESHERRYSDEKRAETGTFSLFILSFELLSLFRCSLEGH